MTTAGRPTFEPARGGTNKGEGDLSKISKQYSSRDLPGHTKLKYRQKGQLPQTELRGRDLRRDLEERERANKEKRVTRHEAAKRPRIEAAHMDADDPFDVDSSSSDDSDEDDTATLLAELNRIKRERAIEKSKLDDERKEREERIRTENILQGNPLLTHQNTFKVKRRWDDDVIFKNCARDSKKNAKKEFVNDMVRSEFHLKFLDRYIK